MQTQLSKTDANLNYQEREGDLIELYFSAVKILAQRPSHISAVATVLLITRHSQSNIITEGYRQIQRQ